ncbi:DNA-binding MarR family transcriptional regulator [Paraburkholderia sp. BL27I4N3]|uniref:MarR family winged helix-turn-helix transcriptional regulator n=1 Tax=Paraburkholderia sp. BL27I4N3 TaxID=1938805 RepID=UPI000E21E4EB|nr:MarR family winged helix-turn-helix transcriptional regulator [Paraburkholderia sp. BL27I4N3]REE19371.1 DNA-binding MarR family transcriptional regulator [Paraburkholderia sp. BL27I4N3]
MKNVDQLPVGNPGDVLAENWLIRRFVEVDRAISRSTDQQLNSLVGISSTQAKTIACLAHQPCLTQAQLAHRLNYDVGAVSRLISHLVASGIATKRRQPQDRRSWSISLTGRGADMLADIAAILKAVDDRSTGALTNDEEYFLVALLKRLLVNAARHMERVTKSA